MASSLGQLPFDEDLFFFHAFTVGCRISLGREVLQELTVFGRSNSLFPIEVLFLDLFDVVCVPRRGWIVNLETLALEAF